VEQRYGKQYCADEFSAEDGRICVSYASAYPAEAGISSLRRELTVSERGACCRDSFVFSDDNKRSITEVLMSVLPVKVESGVVIIDGKYRVSSNASDITVEFVPFDDAPLSRDWEAEGVNRISLAFSDVDFVEINVEKIK
jgi:hypothetical protein